MGLVTRDVDAGDAVAVAMATAAGPHGVYVRNALAGAEGAAFVMGRGGEAFVVAAMTALVWRKHAENIARLRAGTESRIGQKT